MNISLDVMKAFGGFFTALAGWGLGVIAQAVDQIPPWIKAADTPLVIIGLSYGMVHLWRTLSAERAARIADRDAFQLSLRTEAEKGEASRRELLTATNVQTNVMRDLVREMRIKGLHKPAEGED